MARSQPIVEQACGTTDADWTTISLENARTKYQVVTSATVAARFIIKNLLIIAEYNLMCGIMNFLNGKVELIILLYTHLL